MRGLAIEAEFRGLKFAWDDNKARLNLKNHDVGFCEARTVFADPMARIFDDITHSEQEEREIIIGHSANDRLLLVFFTEREYAIRIISARNATKKERDEYEKNVFRKTS
jgi:uncharacterized protein